MSTTIHDLLAEYTELAPDARTKGRYFERLIQNFFRFDPLFNAKYDEVWQWDEWPGRDGKVDTGIDLVARERYSGALCAIQCKFFAPEHAIQKSDIDSFFTASGKHGFSSRIIVSTSTKWSKHATDALVGQQIPTTRLGLEELEASEIDWSTYSLVRGEQPELQARKQPRPHQKLALGDVLHGLDEHDRGQLIMACGTGKTFTSLRIAERLAPKGGSVLFLVPSIALLAQSLREWNAQADAPMRSFAVCSDTRVGKHSEDYTLADLSFPATTDAAKLVAQVAAGSNPDGLTVFFSTYQSIGVIHEAQLNGLAEFDLVICDEAHRTTGVTLSGDAQESHFVRVHDADYLRADKRLYMTATPKIYGDGVKAKAKDAAAELASMDDQSKFGPVLHRLGFGAAVEQNLLSDYRVLVLAVDQAAVAPAFQAQFADEASELQLDDAARIAGIYKAFTKQGVEGLDAWKPADRNPMRRAVAFSRSIADSQRVQRMLDDNFALAASLEEDDDPLVMRAQHVDGTMNIAERTEKLEWLKAPFDRAGRDRTGAEHDALNEVRILTNARCLSEGVDVPALDAVIFLNSRDSQVDVVQSVGRVMRRAEGKEYGYIVLPIAIEAGVEPEKALNDNAKYKVVWDVLRALRAHDERFEAKIEALDLNRRARDPQIQVIGIGGDGADGEPGLTAKQGDDAQAVLGGIDWSDAVREAVYARLVKKVGDRDYWENWAGSIADVASAQIERIRSLKSHSVKVRKQFDRFVKGLQDNLNPSVTEEQALEMLAHHIITQPVLDTLFPGVGFASRNPVAIQMNQMLEALEGTNVDSETTQLEGFYDSVRTRVAQITDAAGKQEFLKLLYQRFFAVAMKKASERLGIVYTPTEIVQFILRSVDWVLREQFDSSLSAEGVHVLDPFTGTGTFIAELIHSDLISDADLPRKFRHELWANEINLLAYYVAAVNIEEAYQSRMGGEPVAFPGIVLADTFQMTEADDELDGEGVFEANNAAAKREMAAPISVIVGNPPYSVGQSSGNDDNQNLKYKSLDERIKSTYAARSTATNKNSLYDSYIRAIRWASDRIGERGVVGFVTNGGFVEGNTADGLRKVLAEEFSDLYVFNLRGNARTSGEQRRREKDNVFGQGARTTIVIALFVRSGQAGGGLYYHDVGDYLTTQQKLNSINSLGSAENASWVAIQSNIAGDWVGQRDSEFDLYRPIASHFRVFSRGVESGRDSWVYNDSLQTLQANVVSIVDEFNNEVHRWATNGRPKDIQKFVNGDPTRISWSRSLRTSLSRERTVAVDTSGFRESLYRPFHRRNVYFDGTLNHERAKTPTYFPARSSANFGFVLTSPSSHYPTFELLAVDGLPDVHTLDTGQFFPRYTYEKRVADDNQLLGFDGDDQPEYVRIDNVTDGILADYRATYGDALPVDDTAAKDDIFFYVYGLLHSPEYRERFAADLKKMLPRIPKVADFRGFADAGRQLSELHLGYEGIEPWPLEEDWHVVGMFTDDLGGDNIPEGIDPYRVVKMKYASKADKSTVIVNEHLTLRGIPNEAHEYLLGSRTALDWILERYQIKTDKASQIVNDPNDWGREHGDSRYIIDLVKRITRVSVETVAIVKALPALEILEQQ